MNAQQKKQQKKHHSKIQGATIADVMYYLLFTSQELDSVKEENVLDGLVEEKLAKIAMWPPDVFCLAAALLNESNAYTRSRDILPHGRTDFRALAKEWLNNVARGTSYDYVLGKLLALSTGTDAKSEQDSRRRNRPINSALVKEDVIPSLIELIVVSDYACEGFGLPRSSAKGAEPSRIAALYRASKRLEPGFGGSTLCEHIDPTKARVLPRTHTPARGLSLRSLSHHLAYVEPEQGSPLWSVVPGLAAELSSLNVLLIPYPYSIRSGSFRPAEHLGEGHAYFEYQPEDSEGECVGKIEDLCRKAESESGRRVDMVVLPEMALNVRDYRLLRASMRERGTILICGVGGTTQQGQDQNRICMDIPLGDRYAVHLRQKKHHHWQLDENQIRQYILTPVLDPGIRYWEKLTIGDRHLSFLALHPQVLASVLICEDLAQYEPVGKLVRSVGPNLVIALLMDAPQIKGRWPDRYASVLADDPGCSVLTLTCLGMSIRSRKPTSERGEEDRSRVVGLWKDQFNAAQEIEIAVGAEGILVNLTIEAVKEWTFDLRARTAYVPRLASQEQIFPDRVRGEGHVRAKSKHSGSRIELAPGDVSGLLRLASIQAAVRATNTDFEEFGTCHGRGYCIEGGGDEEIRTFYLRCWPQIRSRLTDHAQKIADRMVHEFYEEHAGKVSAEAEPERASQLPWTLVQIQKRACRFLGETQLQDLEERRHQAQIINLVRKWTASDGNTI
jgi:hypothetical protein